MNIISILKKDEGYGDRVFYPNSDTKVVIHASVAAEKRNGSFFWGKDAEKNYISKHHNEYLDCYENNVNNFNKTFNRVVNKNGTRI